MRCLGVKAWEGFFIYLIQIIFIGMAGAALGTGLQFLLPMVLKDLLPAEFSMHIFWTAIFQGIINRCRIRNGRDMERKIEISVKYGYILGEF